MRRLVPLPIDQIRPKLPWLREYWTSRAILGTAAGAASLFFVLFAIGFLMHYPVRSSRGFYVRTAATEACNPAIPVIDVRSLRPPARLSRDELWSWYRTPKPDLYFNGEHIEDDNLIPPLQRLTVNAPVPVVLVRGDREANVQDVYAAIDQLRGFDQKLEVVLVTPGREQSCSLPRPRKQKAPRK